MSVRRLVEDKVMSPLDTSLEDTIYEVTLPSADEVIESLGTAETDVGTELAGSEVGDIMVWLVDGNNVISWLEGAELGASVDADG